MRRAVLIQPVAVPEWRRLALPVRDRLVRALRRLGDVDRPLVARERIERDGRLLLIIEETAPHYRSRLMAVEIVGVDELIIWACGSERGFHDRLRRRLDELGSDTACALTGVADLTSARRQRCLLPRSHRRSRPAETIRSRRACR